jgi:hypothetical protein
LATVLGCADSDLVYSSTDSSGHILAGNPRRFRLIMDEDLQKKLNKLKPKKPKPTIPEGFLDGANSYEEKQMLIQILADKERQRVVLLFKKMIQSGIEEKNRKKGVK